MLAGGGNVLLGKGDGPVRGNVTKAAQALGMSRQNLQYRLRKIKKNAQST
ncbi:helix-turn-helix domain-containing protein [Planococcus maritimus]